MSKLTEAQKRANRKYVDKTYNRFTVSIRKTETEAMQNYMSKLGCGSKNKIVLSALKYCIDNDIDLSEYIK